MRRKECLQKGCAGQKGPGQVAFHLGDVPEVEEVVDLGGCGQEALHHGVVHVPGGLGHHIPNGLHLLLEVLKLLIDHGAKYADDLGFLETGPQTHFYSFLAFQPGLGLGRGE